MNRGEYVPGIIHFASHSLSPFPLISVRQALSLKFGGIAQCARIT